MSTVSWVRRGRVAVAVGLVAAAVMGVTAPAARAQAFDDDDDDEVLWDGDDDDDDMSYENADDDDMSYADDDDDDDGAAGGGLETIELPHGEGHETYGVDANVRRVGPWLEGTAVVVLPDRSRANLTFHDKGVNVAVGGAKVLLELSSQQAIVNGKRIDIGHLDPRIPFAKTTPAHRAVLALAAVLSSGPGADLVDKLRSSGIDSKGLVCKIVSKVIAFIIKKAAPWACKVACKVALKRIPILGPVACKYWGKLCELALKEGLGELTDYVMKKLWSK